MKQTKAVVAFSGGKDSTAAVLLLQRRGYRVEAWHMALGLEGEAEHLARLEGLAARIDVPLRVIDMAEEFRRTVIDYFVAAYGAGRTPNPCVFCNRFIKFGRLLQQVHREDPSAVFASGHYAAKVEEAGRFFLCEPRERRKSQIYFMGWIEPAALAGVEFPLAERTIDEVRELVRGLPLGNTIESQDVCFLHDQSLVDFLRRWLPQAFRPGDFLDAAGRVIGRHEGAVHYTVGQRRGTGFASGRRLYVLAVDSGRNTVTLGEDDRLYRSWLRLARPQYWRPLAVGEALRAKIRYATPAAAVEITAVEESALTARFAAPMRAVTPGQFGVLYDGGRIVAAGEIEEFNPPQTGA